MTISQQTIAAINKLSDSPSVSRNIELLRFILQSSFKAKSLLEKTPSRWDQRILNADDQLKKYFINIITILDPSEPETANTDIDNNINLLQIMSEDRYSDIQGELKTSHTHWGKLMLAGGSQFKNYLVNTAISIGNLEFINSIKAMEGINLTRNEKEKHALLQYSVKLGAAKFVATLVDQEKMSVNTTDNADTPLLFIAAQNRDHVMLELLIKKGANLKYRDSRGYNALAIVIDSQSMCFTPSRGNWYNSAKCLLDANIDTKAVDTDIAKSAMNMKWYSQFPAEQSAVEQHEAKRTKWHNRFYSEASEINYYAKKIANQNAIAVQSRLSNR